MRPSWDTTWMNVAHVIANRSRCDRAQVGAVIVDSSNRIIATGHNGPPAGLNVGSAGSCSAWCERGSQGPTEATVASYTDCSSIHAELNCLLFVDRRLCEGGTIYVTGPTCWTCSKAIANSGLARVVVADDGDRSYREPKANYDLLRHSGLEVEEL